MEEIMKKEEVIEQLPYTERMLLDRWQWLIFCCRHSHYITINHSPSQHTSFCLIGQDLLVRLIKSETQFAYYYSLIMQLQPKPQLHSQDSSEEELDQIPQEQQEEKYITDPQEYLQFCVSDKKIKVMDECNPIWSHVYLKDISLHKKGPLQDKIYSRVGKYYRNIRRGNTLCQIYHSSTSNTYDLFFCRRGMKKFYDLEPQYLLLNAPLSTQHRLMRKRIFQVLQRELQQPGAQYHLYRLFKENGEHCQIGYVKQLNSWLFASKNVAILARTPEDLTDYYHKERFYWAKLVGEEFFRTLSKWSNEQVQNFKQDMEGKTLLGEHCGNEQHQHITKYNQVQIIFYGLVDNIGTDHCRPVDECCSFLTKYGLTMSATHSKCGLGDKTSILAGMHEMLKAVAQGSMEVEGQGSVMYIVCEREGKQRTIGMCKLKTCEYLIYRRLREMLKLNVSRKGATANHADKYKYDIEQLLARYFQPPKPLSFYAKLGQKAFRQIGTNAEISQTYLRYKFVDFIQQIQQAENQAKHLEVKTQAPKAKRILLVCLPRTATGVQKYCKGKEIDWEYMYRSAGKPPSKNILHILYMIPRITALQPQSHLIIGQYEAKQVEDCVQQLGECKDISKSHLITFIKSADRAKTVRMLSDKIDAFRESCIKQRISFTTLHHPSQETIISQLQRTFEEEKAHSISVNHQSPHRYVVLPMLIPGSGKSSLAQQLRKSEYEWRIIDTDQIRRQLMEAESEVDLDSQTSQELFIKAKQEAMQQYKQQLLAEVSAPINKDSFLYIDRLFSPYNLQQTINLLLGSKQPFLRIIVLTQTYFPVRLGQYIYPHSWNYLFTCLRRCLERQSHQTMANNPYDVAKIVLRCFQMSANFNEKTIVRANEEATRLAGQEGVRFVQLTFVEDNEGSHYIHQGLKKKLEECMRLIEPGKHAKNSSVFVELIESIYKHTQPKEDSGLKKYHQLRLQLQKQLTQSWS